MGRVPKTPENIFIIPSGASVSRGYVYLNTSSYWKKSDDRLIPTHDKLAIGITVVGKDGDWKSDRRMYANKNFHEIRRRLSEAETNIDEEEKNSCSYRKADGVKSQRSSEALQKRPNQKY